MLISFSVIRKLICAFVFAYSKFRFSHDVSQIQVFFFISDGLVGMAIVGGAALAIGGLVGLGVALTKK